MKVGEKRRRDARDEPTSDQTRWDAREEEAEPEPHVFFFLFWFYMLTWLAGNWYPIKIT